MKPLLLVLLLGLFIGTPHAGAPDLERADLARLVEDIDYWLAEIKALEARSPETGRTRFDFSALSQDLTQIRRRIAGHLQGEVLRFNQLAPLPGAPELTPQRHATHD